ncbi:MAG TPA: hypothetical protein VMU93_16740 [Caulobacteraceae bacterium]|nr:hypothetical protein [Caulobacteraceae bacterium]
MDFTKIAPPYRSKLGSSDTEYDLEVTNCRFYGVIAKPTLRGSVMSPQELDHQRSSYTVSQQEELRWRTGEWQGKPTEPPPEFTDAIALTVFGEVRLTTKRNINVIEEDGSNNRYRGKVTLSVSEGNPKLSRMHAVPAFDMDDEKVEGSLNFNLYTSRAQLEFLFHELGGRDAGLGFRLDVWGFMFGPERSFATFRQTQDYYLERTAIISEFSLSTHLGEEIRANEPKGEELEPSPPPPPPPAPVDYRPELRRLARGLSILIAVSGLTLAISFLRACAGH